MTANSMQLQERQVVNIADGKCLGNLKDIELNIWTGRIESLILPAINGFWNRLQNSGELVISWDKVVRIGVDVILVDVPELSEYEMLFGKSKRKKQNKNTETPLWQQEVQAYRDETSSDTIIMLNREDYREV
ncbi:MAG: YlmC/YmxH family sporulation protein [Peptococcaceae bacterium]|nr:YlmC/YmxH family sporulation protein [Peptococcaceae bacterium]